MGDIQFLTIPDNWIWWLEQPFLESEILVSIKDLEKDKAPGPDGFPVAPFLTFWETFRPNFLKFFDEFFHRGILYKAMNVTFIALVPKKEGAEELKDFRPISLINSTYKILAKAGLLFGFKSNPRGPVVSYLQYTDDTLVLLDAGPNEIEDLRIFLKCFEYATGFRVNMEKSTMIGVALTQAETRALILEWECKVDNLPTSYLGMPLGLGKPKKRQWSHIIDKVDRRLAGWKGRYLSFAGRNTHIKATLANALVYNMSLFHMPVSVASRLEELMRKFLWSGEADSKKFHLIAWDKVCQPKHLGGLGIRLLRKQNSALLGKWWW
ncbi:uncharacterized protein LOC105420077 [Amborella trichopoda]|uniref:uncharacterized protein LOC105420077 n=1 Tax=Amborella trichopoda TaxID=13333 RepID=UPI0005D394F1|nr:uncharacterized protein LOC105420077 [Amborella trichopoda]|eukprot:XP_011620603.1 uncharacterized protein LOC105420077 [Amborella trichopoda]